MIILKILLDFYIVFFLNETTRTFSSFFSEIKLFFGKHSFMIHFESKNIKNEINFFFCPDKYRNSRFFLACHKICETGEVNYKCDFLFP